VFELFFSHILLYFNFDKERLGKGDFYVLCVLESSSSFCRPCEAVSFWSHDASLKLPVMWGSEYLRECGEEADSVSDCSIIVALEKRLYLD